MVKKAEEAVVQPEEKDVAQPERTWTKATDKEAVLEVVPKQRMFYPDGIRHALERAIEMDMPVLMVGDTGTGKTSFIRELAREHGTELIRLSLTGNTGVDELVGKHLVRAKEVKTMARVTDGKTGKMKMEEVTNVVPETYWVNGPIIEAMQNGLWIVLDEVNMALPEILAKLHSLLDDDKKIFLPEKNNEVVRPAPNFRVFGAMNPSDEYAGTKDLNKAFLSRFPVVLDVDYSDNEMDILVDRTSIDGKLASQLVLLANQIRSGKEKANVTYTCSTRDLIYCAQLIQGGIPKESAIKYALINKAPLEERPALSKMVTLVMGKDIVIDEGGKKYTGLEDILKEFKNSARIIKDLKDKKETAEKRVLKQEGENDKLKVKNIDLEKQLAQSKTREEELREKMNSLLELLPDTK